MKLIKLIKRKIVEFLSEKEVDKNVKGYRPGMVFMGWREANELCAKIENTINSETKKEAEKEPDHIFDVYDDIARKLYVNSRFFLLLLYRFESSEMYELCIPLRDYLVSKCMFKNIELHKQRAIDQFNTDIKANGLNGVVYIINMENSFLFAEETILKYTLNESKKENVHRDRSGH